MADTCQNPSIQARLSLIFSLILVIFAWDLEQIQQRAHPMRLSERDLVQKLLMSNRILTWDCLTQQGDEAGKLPIFFYVC